MEPIQDQSPEVTAAMDDVVSEQDELSYLKSRADQLGITYGGRIGIEALRAKINEKLESAEPEVAVVPAAALSEREQLIADAMKLVRLRITNMDPKKAQLFGEVVTVANGVIGTVRKFIPFNAEASENGYHVPYVIYEFLKEKKFQQIRVTKDRRTGVEVVERRQVNEYALEALPPLTPEELAELRAAQAAGGNID